MRTRLTTRQLRRIISILCGGLVLFGALAILPGLFLLNLGGIAVLNSVFVSAHDVDSAKQRLHTAAAWRQPQAYWLLGMLANWQQDDKGRQQAQAALIAQTADRLALLRIVAAQDQILAQQALLHYPTATEALAWRADQLVMQDPQQAIQLYIRALDQDPIQYDWWLGLGKAYVQIGDDQAALTAYEKGCELASGVLPCHELEQLRQKVQSK